MSHSFDIKETGLSGEVAGEGEPILLLHGLTATRRYVLQGSSLLARRGFRLASYDARGHGESAPAPDPAAYEYADLVDDLRSVLALLELERPVLAGSSMGAATALALALAGARPGFGARADHAGLRRLAPVGPRRPRGVGGAGGRPRRGRHRGLRGPVGSQRDSRALPGDGPDGGPPAPGAPRAPRRGGRRPAGGPPLARLRGPGGPGRARRARARGRQPRRHGPRPPARRGRGVREEAAPGAPGRGGRGRLAARVAGVEPVEGDRGVPRATRREVHSYRADPMRTIVAPSSTATG